MSSILVITHEPHGRSTVADVLGAAGYPTRVVDAGWDVPGELGSVAPELVVIDSAPPGFDIVGLLARLRRAGDLPMIVFGPAEERRMIDLLDAGADDYLGWPCSPEALLARVRAVLRRYERASRHSLVLGGLAIDVAARTVALDGVPLVLSPKEFDLLSYMAGRAGEVVSKRELLAEVWQTPERELDKTVDVHVSWLRRKLRETAKSPRYLHTVRGVGLRLDVPVS
ncbi:MAG TPA: response regulator transcription factor [Pseudonocardia sp.]